MIVIYQPDTFFVTQTVTTFAPEYKAFLTAQGESFVEVEGLYDADQIGVKVIDGVPTAILKEEMPVLGSPTAFVDQEISISGVPEGTTITGDVAWCVMDESETLDLTFEHPGTYTILFQHPHYITKEITVEVNAQ